MTNSDDVIGFDGRALTIASREGGASRVVITIPVADLRALWKAVGRYARLSGEEELGGFFDFVKKAGKAIGSVVKEVVKSPIVKAVVGVVPGGATVMTAAEVGITAIEAADRALRKNPKTQKILANLESGKPDVKKAAAAAIKRLPPPVKRQVEAQLALRKETAALAKKTVILKGILKQAGYTPRLQAAFRMPPAPWRR